MCDYYLGGNQQHEQDRGAADDVAMALLSPGPETPVEDAASPYGTSAASPTIAAADAARCRHGLDLNTPHAASANNARAASAPTLASAHAAPSGEVLLPANAEVIHKNVLAYTTSVAATTFRRVQRLRQPRLSGRPPVVTA